MSRYAFDPAKWARWFITFYKPVQPLNPGVFDEPKTCIGINEEWAVKAVRALDILADWRTWETGANINFLEQQTALLQEYVLKMTGCQDNCPDCPDCPIVLTLPRKKAEVV